jgi:hypothetical protein
VQYERVRTWLREAEMLAKLPKQRGASFHAYRRAWATARKHLPLTDVAAAGGWRSTPTLQRCYQQADEQTTLSVVLGGAELRGEEGVIPGGSCTDLCTAQALRACRVAVRFVAAVTSGR